MVYAFLIHTTDGSVIRLLYSYCFSAEASDVTRSTRRSRLEQVAGRVQVVFDVEQRLAAHSPSHHLARLTSEGVVPELHTGVMRLPKGQPYPREMVVVWAAAIDVAYTFICYPEENLVLANNILTTLIQYMQEYVGVMLEVEDCLTKADHLDLLIHHLVPRGQLLFLNHRLIKHAERAIEKGLATYRHS